MPLIDPSGRPIAAPKPAAGPTPSAPASGASSSGAPSSGAPSAVKDVGLESFATEVLQASLEVPIIVDFWAPWCGPCKTLGPILEKVVAETKGAVRMVKVNIDDNPEIAQQLRIQSIPTVYAFKNGQPVDGFMGAIPETQIRAFVAALAGDAAPGGGVEETLDEADQALAAHDLSQAAQIYAQILQEDPGNPRAVAGLAKCYLESGDLERAKKTLGLVRPDGMTDQAIRTVEAELQLKEKAASAGDMAPLRAALDANPADSQARYDLAIALEGKGDREGAITELLEIVRRDRSWNEDQARKQLVVLFEAMGPADPRTLAARRRLSALLFS